ncbi:MAG: hypothetical protein C5S49_06280 [Candidatus Methanogaster sp.]|nr:MAG: hypothetical protein C5S49_06280 [ANME-2 cluster archaeon]
MPKVFRSSRLDELKEEQRNVRDAIFELRNNENISFKVWEWETAKEIPSGKSADTVQSEGIVGSDVYILILGSEYGDFEYGGSSTHKEYKIACSEIEEDCILIYIKEVEERDKKLKKWIEEIRDKYTYKPFKNTDQLKGLVKDKLRYLWQNKFERMDFKEIGVYKSVNDLTPDDFDIQKYHDAYISRNSDEKIKSALKEGKNILIVGRPMAGKTRAAFEAIKLSDDFKGFDVLKPLPILSKLSRVSISKLELRRDTVLFLDDLNKFAGISEFVDISSSIQYLIKKLKISRYDLPIIATCRSGEEQKKAKEEFISILRDFDEIEIEDISKKEGKKLADATGLEFGEYDFDHTPGSVTLDLKDMKTRYDRLWEESKSIFRILKILTEGGIFVSEEKTVKSVGKR